MNVQNFYYCMQKQKKQKVEANDLLKKYKTWKASGKRNNIILLNNYLFSMHQIEKHYKTFTCHLNLMTAKQKKLEILKYFYKRVLSIDSVKSERLQFLLLRDWMERY